MKEMMERAGNSHLLTILSYPNTGHLIEPPYTPHFRSTAFKAAITQQKSKFRDQMTPTMQNQESVKFRASCPPCSVCSVGWRDGGTLLGSGRLLEKGAGLSEAESVCQHCFILKPITMATANDCRCSNCWFPPCNWEEHECKQSLEC